MSKLDTKKRPTKNSSSAVSDEIATASSGMPRQYTNHTGPMAYRDTVKEMSSGISSGHGASRRKEIGKKFKSK